MWLCCGRRSFVDGGDGGDGVLVDVDDGRAAAVLLFLVIGAMWVTVLVVGITRVARATGARWAIRAVVGTYLHLELLLRCAAELGRRAALRHARDVVYQSLKEVVEKLVAVVVEVPGAARAKQQVEVCQRGI